MSVQDHFPLSPEATNEALKPSPAPLPITANAEPPAGINPPGQRGGHPLWRPFRRFLPFIVIGILMLFTLLTAVVLMSRQGGDKTSKKAEIVWWGLWEEESVVKPLIAKYEVSHQNISIRYIKQSPQDYRDRLNSSLARGAGPDIFRFHNTWVPMLKSELAAIPSEVISTSSFSQTFYPVATQDLIKESQIFGIPLMIDGLALLVNEEMFEQGKVAFPSSWEELRAAALGLTQRNEQNQITQAGVALGTTGNTDHWQDILSLMFLQNGADLVNPTGKRAEDALEFYTVFTMLDKVWDETLPPSTLAFESGKLAMYFAPSWRTFEIRAANPSLRFKVLPVPQLPKSSPEGKDITWASFWVEGVWGRSKVKKEALEFLKFISGKEQMEEIYASAAKSDLFREPPARRDLAATLLDDPFVGPYIKQSENARSWYLAGNTYDGPTGVNSRISKYFEDAVNKVRRGETPASALKTVEQGIQQVLGSYGVAR